MKVKIVFRERKRDDLLMFSSDEQRIGVCHHAL